MKLFQELTAINILDAVIAVAVFVGIFIFFLRKKSIKLLVLFASFFVVYIGVTILSLAYEIPIAKTLFNYAALFFVVSFIVVYQNDLKAAFFNLTKTHEKNGGENKLSDEELRSAIDEIIKATQTFSKMRTGALIVIAQSNVPQHILDTGVALGALVSQPLLESIFNTRAPFHDGASIIRGNKVLAAGCFLPLSQSQTIAKNLGTRHRAGIGITEESDMLTIIVSEETGIISTAKKGELRRFVTPDRLRDVLSEAYEIAPPRKTRRGF